MSLSDFIIFLISYIIGFLTAFWFFKHHMIKSEIEYLRDEFKRIHERLITVLNEWQKKHSS